MELWIRNQTKTKLAKINNLEIKQFEEGYGIGQWLDTDSFYGLGIYKSKERALEVLDEIQNIISPKCMISQMTDKIDFEYIDMPIVYEIPEN